jgi:hypothetical protein
MFTNKNRAFYNAASVMTIDTIAEEKSIKYLIDRFQSSAMNISEACASYLLQRTENIPYYVQFIAFEIWQDLILRQDKSIENKHIDDAIERVLNLKSDYYWELTNRQTSYRKKVLYAISQSVEELFSKKVTKAFNLGAVSSTQKAIDVFIEDGIIERKESKYYFSDPLYKIFVIRTL